MNATLAHAVERKLPASSRIVSLGYLRAFVTLLVVAHHAFLAYHRYAPPAPKALTDSMWWTAFPVSDTKRWPGIELFIGFNDVFFMSLMFLIAGIFVPASLARKGARQYLADRVVRLGIPFVIGAGLLAPLAYYPSYLAGARLSSFWSQWLSLSVWPAGPVWFLWVLLVLSGIAALASPRLKVPAGPFAFFAALVVVSACAYVPMATIFTPERWFSAGPFFVQSSRILHYPVYFFAGMGLGAAGLQQGLLAPDGKLARRWYLWVITAVLAFALTIVAVVLILPTLGTGGPSIGLRTFGNLAFVLSCAASSMAFLALFLRFARNANAMFDSLAANAYGIYLFHYFCVSWTQFALLNVDWPGSLKGTTVFVTAVGLSWLLAAILRRIRGPAMIVS